MIAPRPAARTPAYRGRFAPSPTGDLHLGGARTALLAWLDARAAPGGGAAILRMEDLDRPRAVAGADARIVADLAALGLGWDEGPPPLGGPHAPYHQAARGALYEAALARLEAGGHLYRCYCSRAEIARAAEGIGRAPHGLAEEGPRYPGTCRALSAEQRAAHERAGRRPSLRFRVEPGQVAFVDRVAGPRAQDPAAETGDFIVRRADGLHAYQLAVVVDDAAMGVTDVVRGDDLLSSTARQILLHRALGSTPPRWAHVPLLLGPDGARLSKRHGAIAVRALLARGMSAPRLVALLARSAGLAAPDEATPAELVAAWAPAALSREAARIDPSAWESAAARA